MIDSSSGDQYPVIAVDSAVPVTRPGGAPSGRLQVLLAMGTERQLLALKQLHSQQANALQRAFIAELTAPLPSVPVSFMLLIILFKILYNVITLY